MATATEGSEQETLGTRSEIESLDACKRRIKAAIPAEKVREELDKSYRELAQTVQLPGFRRGRVPRKLLEARFGEELEKELKEQLVNVSFAQVVEEKELKAIGSPKFDNVQFVHDADLTYEAEIEVWPKVELGSYEGIEVSREPIPVKDEEIDEQLRMLQRNRAQITAIDVASAGPDDYYVGRYSLVRDGVKVKTSDVTRFTPSSKRLDAFVVEDLVDRVKAWDHASGAPLSLVVKVPPDFSDEVLRGADVTLDFQLEETRRVDLPPLDDKFAEELGKKDLAELKQEVRSSIEARNRRQEDQKIEEKLLDKILATSSMDVPEGLLESQKRRWRANREYELLSEQGLKPDEMKATLEKEGEAAAEDLKRELKLYFILETIADGEKVFVMEEEVDRRVELLSAYYGVPASRLREEMRTTGRMEDIRSTLRHGKVRALLRRKARILGPDGQLEEPPKAVDPALEGLSEAESEGAAELAGGGVAGEATPREPEGT